MTATNCVNFFFFFQVSSPLDSPPPSMISNGYLQSSSDAYKLSPSLFCDESIPPLPPPLSPLNNLTKNVLFQTHIGERSRVWMIHYVMSTL